MAEPTALQTLPNCRSHQWFQEVEATYFRKGGVTKGTQGFRRAASGWCRSWEDLDLWLDLEDKIYDDASPRRALESFEF